MIFKPLSIVHRATLSSLLEFPVWVCSAFVVSNREEDLQRMSWWCGIFSQRVTWLAYPSEYEETDIIETNERFSILRHFGEVKPPFNNKQVKKGQISTTWKLWSWSFKYGHFVRANLTCLCFDTKISETKFCHVKGYQVGHIVLEIDRIDCRKVKCSATIFPNCKIIYLCSYLFYW